MQRSILLTLLTTSLVSAVSVPRVITPLRARISTSTTTSDTCDYVDLSTPVNVTGVNAHSVTVEACLCLSNIATYASELAATLGHSASQRGNLTAALTTSLTNEIKDNSPQTCHYPANGIPQCLASNPCSYLCPPNSKPGSDEHGNPSCECTGDYFSCDGLCIPTSQKCSSTSTVSEKQQSSRVRRQQVSVQAKKRRDVAEPSCPGRKSVCGIPGRAAGEWECVDAQSDLWSCGGCIEPFFKYSKAGTDCTQISNMSDVACVRGSCQVFKCAKGFVVGSDGASCVPDSSMGNDTESVLVLNPSLEH